MIIDDNGGNKMTSGFITGPKTEINTDNAVGELYDHERRLNLLFEISKEMSLSAEISMALGHILDITQNTLQCSASSVFLLDKNERDIYPHVAKGNVSNALNKIKLIPPMLPETVVFIEKLIK